MIALQDGKQGKALADFDRRDSRRRTSAPPIVSAPVSPRQGEDRDALKDLNVFLAAGRDWDADSGVAHAQVGCTSE